MGNLRGKGTESVDHAAGLFAAHQREEFKLAVKRIAKTHERYDTAPDFLLLSI